MTEYNLIFYWNVAMHGKICTPGRLYYWNIINFKIMFWLYTFLS